MSWKFEFAASTLTFYLVVFSALIYVIVLFKIGFKKFSPKETIEKENDKKQFLLIKNCFYFFVRWIFPLFFFFIFLNPQLTFFEKKKPQITIILDDSESMFRPLQSPSSTQAFAENLNVNAVDCPWNQIQHFFLQTDFLKKLEKEFSVRFIKLSHFFSVSDSIFNKSQNIKNDIGFDSFSINKPDSFSSDIVLFFSDGIIPKSDKKEYLYNLLSVLETSFFSNSLKSSTKFSPVLTFAVGSEETPFDLDIEDINIPSQLYSPEKIFFSGHLRLRGKTVPQFSQQENLLSDKIPLKILISCEEIGYWEETIPTIASLSNKNKENQKNSIDKSRESQKSDRTFFSAEYPKTMSKEILLSLERSKFEKQLSFSVPFSFEWIMKNTDFNTKDDKKTYEYVFLISANIVPSSESEETSRKRTEKTVLPSFFIDENPFYEWNHFNNFQLFSVKKRTSDLNILLIDEYPRYEYRHLRELLRREPGINLETVLLEELSEPLNLDFSSFDIIILGDISREHLNNGVSEQLKSCFFPENLDFNTKKCQGLWLIAGQKNMPYAFLDSSHSFFLPFSNNFYQAQKEESLIPGTAIYPFWRESSKNFIEMNPELGNNEIDTRNFQFYWTFFLPENEHSPSFQPLLSGRTESEHQNLMKKNADIENNDVKYFESAFEQSDKVTKSNPLLKEKNNDKKAPVIMSFCPVGNGGILWQGTDEIWRLQDIYGYSWYRTFVLSILQILSDSSVISEQEDNQEASRFSEETVLPRDFVLPQKFENDFLDRQKKDEIENLKMDSFSLKNLSDQTQGFFYDLSQPMVFSAEQNSPEIQKKLIKRRILVQDQLYQDLTVLAQQIKPQITKTVQIPLTIKIIILFLLIFLNERLEKKRAVKYT